jgi:hypothetical protein
MPKTLFVSLLFLTLLFGQSSKDFPFMGLSVSTQTIDINSIDSTQETGFGLRYGQQSLDWRTIFALDYTQNSYYGAYLEIDKILLDNMFGTPKLRPYLGGVIGYMSYDDDNLNIPSEESELYEETSGFYFGGNFGFIIYATDNIDIDLSYHYYKIENIEFLDDLHGATFAVHYFF